MTSLSVVILSKTNSDLTFDTTMKCIHSLEESDVFRDELEIILIESNKDYYKNYEYPNSVKIIIPEEEFGFHKFLNIGIQASNGAYIALCNNDLIFESNWFSEILKVAKGQHEIKSFSPIDPRKEIGIYENDYEIGYKIRSFIKGWCLVCDKTIFDTIGPLDEKFKFFYSDNDYSLTLQYYNIKHAVVSNSFVQHLHRVTTSEGVKKKDQFFNQNIGNVKLPKHLKLEGYKEILKSSRALYDHLIYYNKWGNPDSIYRISRYAQKLNSVHLNLITRLLFLIKRIFKV